ncbi:hypothetical protein ADIS_2931 [Lunatimonas lonarensis]|uniref:DUF4097 domain-containing protein n=1 Tax=Lunatimonas lonarensis TaxID=1232681 RepID=R7ZQT2_9BACT|nr:DUF4097 family beta strand repeat-containing protein [Lunatimonas lonarensis]EON76481.1 hypothetical protein ADIS_2931 [Lunatimonas lonarensis]
MRRLIPIFGFVFTVLTLYACDFRPLQLITDEEHTFEGVEEIIVRGGALEVSYVGDEGAKSVSASAYLESSQPNAEGISFRRKGNRLEVFLPGNDSPLSFWTGRTKGHVHLTGPKTIRLDLEASSGVVEVTNVSGEELKFDVSSGKMLLQDLDCTTLKISCSSGKLEAVRVAGNVEMRVSSGMGILREVAGDVYFKGSSGSVQIKEVAGLVSGAMTSGKATVERVQELGDLSISSGYLRVEDGGIGKDTHLSVSSGLMKVRASQSLSEFNYDFSVGSGYLTIGKESGSKDLQINNQAEHTIKGSVQSGKLELLGR